MATIKKQTKKQTESVTTTNVTKTTTIKKQIKNVTITNVTKPEDVSRISKDRNVNLTDVFVRITFKVGDNEYTASQKFGYLPRRHYEKLLNIVNTSETIDLELVCDKDGKPNGFFNVFEEVNLDDLYNAVPKKEFTSTLSNLSDLF